MKQNSLLIFYKKLGSSINQSYKVSLGNFLKNLGKNNFLGI